MQLDFSTTQVHYVKGELHSNQAIFRFTFVFQIQFFSTNMRGVKLGLLCMAVIVLGNLELSSGLSEMVCSTTSNQIIIQPDAEAFIAGFFGLHGSGANGVGCGSISTMGEYRNCSSLSPKIKNGYISYITKSQNIANIIFVLLKTEYMYSKSITAVDKVS